MSEGEGAVAGEVDFEPMRRGNCVWNCKILFRGWLVSGVDLRRSIPPFMNLERRLWYVWFQTALVSNICS